MLALGGLPDFLNSYSFDTLGRMTAETQQGQPSGDVVATKGISFGYDPIGDITSIERYTNITQAPSPTTDAADTTLAYNNLGQLTSEDHSHNGTAIENLSWTFDTLDRVSTFSSNDGLATYGYDKASQIVSATYSGSNPPANFSTTYDPNGVRDATGDTAGPNNHLTSDGTFNFTYDPEGNLIKRMRISTAQANDYEVDYSWDYRNRLTDAYFYNISSVLTQHIHYVYDVFDHLIERDVDPTGGGAYTQVAHYVWDISSSAPGGDGGDGSALGAGEGGVVLEFNGQQQLTNRYLNGPNASASDAFFSTLAEESVTSLTTPGTVTFDLLDNLGSVRNVVDASGNLLNHINYTVTGHEASESNPSVPRLTSFAGGFLDPATQMLNEYHRWLVLADGFWASADPLGLFAGDTNLSRAVWNDPVNVADPSGLKGTGHHLIPWSLFNGNVTKAVQQIFDSDAARIFNEAFKSHNGRKINGIGHPTYTKAVREELMTFLGATEKTFVTKLKDMTPMQAKQFLEQIKKAPLDGIIGKFNKGVRKQAAEALKAANALKAAKALKAAQAAKAAKAASRAKPKVSCSPVPTWFDGIFSDVLDIFEWLRSDEDSFNEWHREKYKDTPIFWTPMGPLPNSNYGFDRPGRYVM